MSNKFTRSQTAKLLELTPIQLDYVSKQFDILPEKIGYASIYTLDQLILVKIALYLKSHKFPIVLIKNTINYIVENLKNGVLLFEKDWCLAAINSEDLQKEFNVELHQVPSYRFFRLLDESDSSDMYFATLTRSEVLKIIGSLNENISQISITSIKPVINNSLKQIITMAEKSNITVNVAA